MLDELFPETNDDSVAILLTYGTARAQLAADLQLASASPKTDLVEYVSGSAYVDDIAADGWKSPSLSFCALTSRELYVAELPQKPGNPGAILTIAHAAREDAVLSYSPAIDRGQPAYGARGLAN